jgi:hypothetical protein
MISVLKFTWWELPMNCKLGVQIRPTSIHSYGKGPSLSAVSLRPLFFWNKVRALSVQCLYVHIMRKDHTSRKSMILCTEPGSNVGNLHEQIWQFSVAIFIGAICYSKCLLYSYLHCIYMCPVSHTDNNFFPCLSTSKYWTHLSMTNNS